MQCRYEALRRQALAPLRAGSEDLEVGFIERQGLAAWLAVGPESFIGQTASADSPNDAPAEAQPPCRDLVVVLTDLILGDRQEPCDGRGT